MKLKKNLNEKQREAVNYIDGPLLINAGPGTGKTLVLIQRTIDIIENEINPSEIVLCTFTEKAAKELKDRIKKSIKVQKNLNKNNYNIDELRIGTIHSICLGIIEEYIEILPIRPGFKILDETDKINFIYKNLNNLDIPSIETPIGEIVQYRDKDFFFEDLDKWEASIFLDKIFNRFSDEALDLNNIFEYIKNKNINEKKKELFFSLSNSYEKYKQLLFEYNYLDFSQSINLCFELIKNKEVRKEIREKIKYIMIDEFQDTNYSQKLLLFEIITSNDKLCNDICYFNCKNNYCNKNICVVGDINQSIYEWRGANIENILTFDRIFKDEIKTINLKKNYRSNKNIINTINNFIEPNLNVYSQKLKIQQDRFLTENVKITNNYKPIIFLSSDRKNITYIKEIKKYIFELKNKGIIQNLRDCAVLLYSIKYSEAKAFMKVFGKEKVDFRNELSFFYKNEIIRILSILYLIGNIDYIKYRKIFDEYFKYITDFVRSDINKKPRYIQIINKKLNNDSDILQIFYTILGELFKNNEYNDSQLKRIAKLSKFIKKYKEIYKNNDIFNFFNTYLGFMYNKLKDSIEISKNDTETDKIQILTIHQSKGLEFPVVIVGINKNINQRNLNRKHKNVNIIIKELIERKNIEENKNIFKYRRLYYVAMSRSEDLLILGARTIKKPFNNIKKFVKMTKKNQNLIFESLKQISTKKKYKEKPIFTFTGDISTYNICPQMYYFLRVLEFEQKEKNKFIFGRLIHSIIEQINREAKNNKYFEMGKNKLYRNIDEIINNHYVYYKKKGIDIYIPYKYVKRQVINYVINFFNIITKNKIFKVEEKISIEKQKYILVGRLDLIIKKSVGELEIIDIKTGKYKNKSRKKIEQYEDQIKLYNYFINSKYNISSKMRIYSTGEDKFQEGNYVVRNERIKDVIKRTEIIIAKILNEDFDTKYENVVNECKNCSYNEICKIFKKGKKNE